MNEVEAAEPGSGAAWGGSGREGGDARRAALGPPGIRRPASADAADGRSSRIAGVLGLLGLVFMRRPSLCLAGRAARARVSARAGRTSRHTAYFLADHAARLFEVSDVVLRGATATDRGGEPGTEIASSEDLPPPPARHHSGPVPYVEDVWLQRRRRRPAADQLRLSGPRAATPPIASSSGSTAGRTTGSMSASGSSAASSGRPSFLLSRRLHRRPTESFRGMVVGDGGARPTSTITGAGSACPLDAQRHPVPDGRQRTPWRRAAAGSRPGGPSCSGPRSAANPREGFVRDRRSGLRASPRRPPAGRGPARSCSG